MISGRSRLRRRGRPHWIGHEHGAHRGVRVRLSLRAAYRPSSPDAVTSRGQSHFKPLFPKPPGPSPSLTVF